MFSVLISRQSEFPTSSVLMAMKLAQIPPAASAEGPMSKTFHLPL